jgi:hypothetical protein
VTSEPSRNLPAGSDVVVVTDRQVACEVGGEAVVLHLDQGVYYGLNPVGARVWQLVQQPSAIDAIVDQVVREFDVEREKCLSDVCELVAVLRSHLLVQVTQGPLS